MLDCPACGGKGCHTCDIAGGWNGPTAGHTIAPEYRCPWPLPQSLDVAMEWHWHEHRPNPKPPRWRWEALEDWAKVCETAEWIAFGCPTCAPFTRPRPTAPDRAPGAVTAPVEPRLFPVT